MSASTIAISTDRRDIVEKSIANSLCFGVYAGERQIGFARVVTDYATFAWLCDVFIDDAHRGQGLGSLMVTCMVRNMGKSPSAQLPARRYTIGLVWSDLALAFDILSVTVDFDAQFMGGFQGCLLYTSDAADADRCGDLALSHDRTRAGAV